ncbi:unnamed protein product [Soboliphyme baturini]|uniref:BESS domain-containing protein n=1 Tax=Soboliphyme baturini TaxID=241478 RepID=A0A183J0W8_9BILA|nr:unnamed protein product [Soboliphyme baturini]
MSIVDIRNNNGIQGKENDAESKRRGMQKRLSVLDSNQKAAAKEEDDEADFMPLHATLLNIIRQLAESHVGKREKHKSAADVAPASAAQAIALTM